MLRSMLKYVGVCNTDATTYDGWCAIADLLITGGRGIDSSGWSGTNLKSTRTSSGHGRSCSFKWQCNNAAGSREP